VGEVKTGYAGRSVPRVDALDKVTGSALYGVDIELPGMFHGATLRSPYAHAKVAHVDISEAIKAPGVKAVVTGRDFPFTFGGSIKDQPFLAIDRVRYVGEPVAAVAAETEAAAQDAVERIRVTYEELPAVFDPREAAEEGAPLLHPHLDEYPRYGPYDVVPGTNICTVRSYTYGDVEKGFFDADEVFEDEFRVQSLAHSPMETHGAVARYAPVSGEFTIWSSNDRPHRVVRELANALGVPINRIRFIVPYVGGSFGGKSTLVAEAIAVALARFTRGRPVKVTFSGEEELTASQSRVAAWMKLKTGVTKEGILTARKAEIFWDNGAYASYAPGVAIRGALTVFGPYRIPNIELDSRLVYTNRMIGGAYRGYGTTQVTWACESQMDMIAHELGLDPLELRLRNGYVQGDRYINGQVLRDVGLKETLEKSSHEIGWGSGKKRVSSSRFRGKGIATTIKGTVTPTESFCIIRLNNDASVTLLLSSAETGGGQKTVLAQIAADTIGVPIESISVQDPDTFITPYDHAVASSRTTFHMGNAIRRASQEVREKILEVAGTLLGLDPSRLSLFQGKVFEEGVGERMALDALMSKWLGGKGSEILAQGYYTPAGSPLLAAYAGREGMSSIFWMYGTHAAEVEVDIETGVVKVLRIAAAHDLGRAINPMTCEQQIEGAVVMGLSNTLFEEFVMVGGRVVNDTLSDYKLATTRDLPEIIPIIVETHHTEGPFGAKGLGEPAAAATAPAIANAIYDAVGIRVKELPITPEKLLAALKAKGVAG
jgi:CO/xanthine dehydrogenase Mo-binding subunit